MKRNFDVFCGVPDRVIDPKVNEDFLKSLSHSELIYFVVNLRAIVARLEAEKQDAHTEGWNAAIEAAAELGYTHEEAGLVGAIMALSKPTAAKQGENPE